MIYVVGDIHAMQLKWVKEIESVPIQAAREGGSLFCYCSRQCGSSRKS